MSLTPWNGYLFKRPGRAIERAGKDRLAPARRVEIDGIGSGHGAGIPVAVIHIRELASPRSGRRVHVVVLTGDGNIISRERPVGHDRGRGEVDPVGRRLGCRVKEGGPIRQNEIDVVEVHVIGLPADGHGLEVGGQGYVTRIFALFNGPHDFGVGASLGHVDPSGSAGIGGGSQGRDARGHIKVRPIDERAHLGGLGVGVHVQPIACREVVGKVRIVPFNERGSRRIPTRAFGDDDAFHRRSVRDGILGGCVRTQVKDEIAVGIHIERAAVLPGDVDRKAVAVEGRGHIPDRGQARRVEILRDAAKLRAGLEQVADGVRGNGRGSFGPARGTIKRRGGSDGLRGGGVVGVVGVMDSMTRPPPPPPPQAVTRTLAANTSMKRFMIMTPY